MLKEPKPRNIVVSTVGSQSLHRNWVSEGNYDTMLIYYGNEHGYEGQSTYYHEQQGPKYHLLKAALKDSELLRNYDYFWFPDDDIFIQPEQVEKLFRYMQTFKLHLAQPAIVGYYSLTVTLPQYDSRLRFTNFVEIMCPCFSKMALKTCIDTFDENKTGWSYDALWNELLDHPRRSIAIIDDVIAVHTRPVFGGELYQNCDMAQNDAMAEGKQLYNKYSLAWRRNNDLQYGTPHISHSYATVVYDVVPKSNEEETPKPERIWPPMEFWQHSVDQLKAGKSTYSIAKR